MLAAGYGHLEVVQWLQQAGADMHATDNVSHTVTLSLGGGWWGGAGMRAEGMEELSKS